MANFLQKIKDGDPMIIIGILLVVVSLLFLVLPGALTKVPEAGKPTFGDEVSREDALAKRNTLLGLGGVMCAIGLIMIGWEVYRG